MAYVITENCINCKYQDCIEECPVDCFHEGENMLVIDPGECIDCAVCEPTCPSDAIISAGDPDYEKWVEFNAKYARIWPGIVRKGVVLPDADAWVNQPGKLKYLSPKPGGSSG